MCDYLLTFYFIPFISYTQPAESKGILQIESIVTYEFDDYVNIVCEVSASFILSALDFLVRAVVL